MNVDDGFSMQILTKETSYRSYTTEQRHQEPLIHGRKCNFDIGAVQHYVKLPAIFQLIAQIDLNAPIRLAQLKII